MQIFFPEVVETCQRVLGVYYFHPECYLYNLYVLNIMRLHGHLDIHLQIQYDDFEDHLPLIFFLRRIISTAACGPIIAISAFGKEKIISVAHLFAKVG